VLQAVLDHGVSLQEAITAPRWSQDMGSQAVLEDSMPLATVEHARKLGIELKKAQPNSPFFGSAEGIHRAPDGGFAGVADFRRDAWAYGE
jgi:gamma-glutamyltranspeptidase/glutathione hydrolase